MNLWISHRRSLHWKISLADKSTEIADAEAELAQAEADKQKQYDDMKTRIQYMYENSQTTYLEQLLESNSVAEFLNTAEYIAEIQKYDRQKLDEYTENIEYITVAKEQLEQDYADLENMKANVESQKQSVAALMSQKETELAGITSNISDAQEDAKYFEAEIQAQNELIAEIKRIEAEKAAAAAKAAAEGKEVAYNPYTGGAFTWPCPSSTRLPVIMERGFHRLQERLQTIKELISVPQQVRRSLQRQTVP